MHCNKISGRAIEFQADVSVISKIRLHGVLMSNDLIMGGQNVDQK